MKKAIKYIYDANPFYVHLKKHVCPKWNYGMLVKLLIQNLPKQNIMISLLEILFLSEMLNLEQDIFIVLNVCLIFLFKK